MPDSSSARRCLFASPSQALSGRCTVPGDKSVSHRAIILAALASGQSVITGIADGADVRRTLAAVEAFGAKVEADGDRLIIQGARWSSPQSPIDCGNSGTAARLLIGAAAAMPGLIATFCGDESLQRRPMNRLFEPLRRMGAQIAPRSATTLPVVVAGKQLTTIDHHNLPPSAQVKSALLFAGLNAHGVQQVLEPELTRDHGEILLEQFGCNIVTDQLDGTHAIGLTGPTGLQPAHIEVGGDPSSAAFIIVASLIVPGSRVQIDNVLVSPTRTGLLDVLEMMGAEVRCHSHRSICGETLASIECRSSKLRPVDVPASIAPRMIDEYPIAAVAAAYAHGVSIFRGLGELRHKESDRLERLATCLIACGVSAQISGDDLIVHGCGQPLCSSLIDSHGDHRIAMAFAVLALGSRHSIAIESADMINTSFPAFVPTMRLLGASIEFGR